MENTNVVISKKKVKEYAGELLVTFVAQGKKGEIIGDLLFEATLKSLQHFKEFTGKKEEYFQIYPAIGQPKGPLQCQRLLLIGLGDLATLSDPNEFFELLRTVGGLIASQCKKNKIETVGINIPELEGLEKAIVCEHVTEGILLGDYQFLKYQKKDDDAYPGLKKIEFLLSSQRSKSQKSIDKGKNSALAVCIARDMANEPGNCWTPGHFAKYAEKVARELNLKCTILEKSDMVKLGMGGIVAVNKGSEEPPKFVILEYLPDKKVKTFCWLAKG